ncbi:DUF3313 domain-containing protein [Rhizobium sp. PL01]|uniref:DUF3313 domain-containing protein n=1 Tax=Rhizobium sp. PL01 TaxID=3085631 RepID=UPI002982AEB1|nr:DUF3313 domain-containing protein [Rhizobium sp. PL01]MDW5315873.1 DUF3313 domain-containing protein [Rhizobium sp. PL01]
MVPAACTSVPLKEGGTLTSYTQLSPVKGKFTKSRTFVDSKGLATVITVSIVPTMFTLEAASRIKAPQDRALVTNALDRAVCVSLSDKYQIVHAGQPADLTVRTVVTDIVATNKTMAGVSTAVSLGSNIALPVGIPRLPVGLGGLAVEAEATDFTGIQRVAVVWSKGANSITNSARASEVGDAYSLASNFGKYLSRMLVSGEEPKGLDLSLPSAHRVNSVLGGKPKFAACDVFGRSPGLAGIVADKVGAPPQWTDKQPKSAGQWAPDS